MLNLVLGVMKSLAIHKRSVKLFLTPITKRVFITHYVCSQTHVEICNLSIKFK